VLGRGLIGNLISSINCFSPEAHKSRKEQGNQTKPFPTKLNHPKPSQTKLGKTTANQQRSKFAIKLTYCTLS
jgi:hypothetical protein